jgi:SAM-dependent methyltransferase
MSDSPSNPPDYESEHRRLPFAQRSRYERAEWVADHLKVPIQRLLDVGGFDGNGTRLSAERAVTTIVVDINLPALRRGRRLNPPLVFVCASGVNLPFKQAAFDAVTCVEVLEHVPEGQERQVLKEIRRVMKPDAQLVLTTPHRGWFAWLDPMDVKPKLRRLLGNREKGHKHFALDELRALLDGLFRIELVYRNSLFLHPISTALGKVDTGWLRPLRYRVSDWDWAHEFGRAAFNVCIVARAI